MAKVIEFYIPENARKPRKWAPEQQLGKVIEFSLAGEEISLAVFPVATIASWRNSAPSKALDFSGCNSRPGGAAHEYCQRAV
jgi:hypothetical protein